MAGTSLKTLLVFFFVCVCSGRKFAERDNESDHERDYKLQTNQEAPEVKGQVQLSNSLT